ncbi:MAG: YgcG family protein [Proteobacteria bacterium]|nr:YgcG family protein [Pseudomonadota bacterium]
MRRTASHLLCGALLCLASLVPAWALVAVPPLNAPVTDLTRSLSTRQVQQLDAQLAGFSARKGSQIAVLIVPTTLPESVEQYSIRVTSIWKLGRKGVDDGVLVLVAKDDHAVRIEVGYGLEGAIPDASAKRIIAEDITPRFRLGDYDGGIQAGVARLMQLIEGEALPPAPAQVQRAQSPQASPIELGLFIIFGAIVLGHALSAAIGRLLGAGASATVAGLTGWLLAGSGLLGLLAAVVAFVVVFSGIRIGGWPGGFGGGGFGGGGLGGGYSGGGGGFGGGGASGRW